MIGIGAALDESTSCPCGLLGWPMADLGRSEEANEHRGQQGGPRYLMRASVRYGAATSVVSSRTAARVQRRLTASQVRAVAAVHLGLLGGSELNSVELLGLGVAQLHDEPPDAVAWFGREQDVLSARLRKFDPKVCSTCPWGDVIGMLHAPQTLQR